MRSFGFGHRSEVHMQVVSADPVYFPLGFTLVLDKFDIGCCRLLIAWFDVNGRLNLYSTAIITQHVLLCLLPTNEAKACHCRNNNGDDAELGDAWLADL